MRPKTSTSSARRLWLFNFTWHYSIYPLYWRDLFEGYCCYCFCNFEVFSFILVKCDCSHKSAISCFSCIFCALSCTFISLPVLDPDIDPCLCLFSQASPQHYSFSAHCMSLWLVQGCPNSVLGPVSERRLSENSEYVNPELRETSRLHMYIQFPE